MTAFLKVAGKWGGIATLILLLIALVKQLIALVGFLMFAIKIVLVLAFVGLMLLILTTMLRTRSRRRREADEI